MGKILALLKLMGGSVPNVREPAFMSTILAFPGMLQELCKSHCWLNSQSIVEGGGKAGATSSIANESQKYALIPCIVLLPRKQTWDPRLKISLTCVETVVHSPPNKGIPEVK